MSFIIPFSTNLVLAAFTAFAELLLIPLSKLISESFEGKQVLREITNATPVKVHRIEVGPLRLPIGRWSFHKLLVSVTLSLGVVIAISVAEYGALPVQTMKPVRRRADAQLVNTGDANFRQGRVNIAAATKSGPWYRCVEVGKLRCLREDGARTCLRSVYYRAVERDNELICIDKDTGLLLSASDADIFAYDDTKASVVAVGEALTVDPPNALLSTNNVTMRLDGRNFTGVQIRVPFADAAGYAFWNSTALFFVLAGPWDDPELGLQLVFGIFPNGKNKPANYIDSLLSMTAHSISQVRVGTISGMLFHVHYASSERREVEFEYEESTLIETTRISVLSYATVALLMAVFLGIAAFSFGQRSGIVTLNGLSKQYDDDKERRGNSGRPKHYVEIGVIREKGMFSQHIGSLMGNVPEKLDSSVPLDADDETDMDIVSGSVSA